MSEQLRRCARRPWVLTDTKCNIGDRDNATTAHAVTSEGRDVKVTFQLANPPAVSRCFVHCPDMTQSRYRGDPVVVSSADAFVLLVVPFTDRYGQREQNNFFVYRAGPGAPSLHLLRGTARYRYPDYSIMLAGVVPLDSADLNNEGYVVVLPRCDNYYTSLQVYRSDISGWPWRNQVVSTARDTAKYHNHEEIMRHQGTRVIFAGKGTLGWVNHWNGILLCNVLEHRPVMLFIQWPVPVPCDMVSRFGMGVHNIYEQPFRDVVISNGVITFIEMKPSWRSDGHNEKGVISQGWTATTWNRKICLKKWHKRFTVKADDMPVTGSSYPNLFGGKRLSWDKVVHCAPTLSLCDDDVIYIMARLDIRPAVAWMLAINIREGTLEAVKQCSAEKMPGLEPTYVRCALSDYLKQRRR